MGIELYAAIIRRDWIRGGVFTQKALCYRGGDLEHAMGRRMEKRKLGKGETGTEKEAEG